MYKYTSFFFIATLLLTQITCVKAQQQLGQIIVNAGVGYSPEFNGTIFFGSYCVPSSIEHMEYPALYGSSTIPNLGITVDYASSNQASIGIASSYQSTFLAYGEGGQAGPPYATDKLTRVNIAFRFLMHLNKNNSWFDHYIGFRPGTSYWHDASSNTYQYIQNGVTYTQTNYFLRTPNYFVASFQLVYGMRFYFSDNIGFHWEFGIGSPYLVEGGITFRFNTTQSK